MQRHEYNHVLVEKKNKARKTAVATLCMNAVYTTNIDINNVIIDCHRIIGGKKPVVQLQPRSG